MKHEYVEHENCYKVVCMICDGGLALCSKCGGLEGSLTTDCPGGILSETTINKVYEGEFDFRAGIGWVQKPSIHSPAYNRKKQLDLMSEIEPEELPL